MKLIYILANHRSGSTLTDCTLNMLDNVLSLGEVVRFSMTEAARVDSFGNRCQCKQRIHNCAVWNARKAAIFEAMALAPEKDWSALGLYPQRKDFAYKLRSVSYLLNYWALSSGTSLPDPLGRYSRASWDFFELLARLENVEYLVDSSKTVTRFLNLYRYRPTDTFVIYLTRDGRGVLNSMTKDLDLHDPRAEARITADSRLICNEQKRMMAIFAQVPAHNKLHCKYEDLCCDPDRFLDRIAEALGTTRQPFTDLLEMPYHALPGSESMRINSHALKVDNAWQSRLTPRALDIYARQGGAIFEQLGYSPL